MARYAHIESTIDTGATTRHVHLPSTREVLTRRDEDFGRVSAVALAGLLASAPATDAGAAGAGTAATGGGAGVRTVVHDAAAAGASTLASAATLIFDVRDDDDFSKLRIVDSVSWPLFRVHQDKVPPLLISARHNAHKRVVIVDENERAAAEVARKLVTSGAYPSVAILTGGFAGIREGRARHAAAMRAAAADAAKADRIAARAASRGLAPPGSAGATASISGVRSGAASARVGMGGASTVMSRATGGGATAALIAGATALESFLVGTEIDAERAAEASEAADWSGEGAASPGRSVDVRVGTGDEAERVMSLRAVGGSPRKVPLARAVGSFGTTPRFTAGESAGGVGGGAARAGGDAVARGGR